MCVFVPVSAATALGRVHSHTPRGSLHAYSVLNHDFLYNLILYKLVGGGWDTQSCSLWLLGSRCRCGCSRGVDRAVVTLR